MAATAVLSCVSVVDVGSSRPLAKQVTLQSCLEWLCGLGSAARRWPPPVCVLCVAFDTSSLVSQSVSRSVTSGENRNHRPGLGAGATRLSCPSQRPQTMAPTRVATNTLLVMRKHSTSNGTAPMLVAVQIQGEINPMGRALQGPEHLCGAVLTPCHVADCAPTGVCARFNKPTDIHTKTNIHISAAASIRGGRLGGIGVLQAAATDLELNLSDNNKRTARVCAAATQTTCLTLAIITFVCETTGGMGYIRAARACAPLHRQAPGAHNQARGHLTQPTSPHQKQPYAHSTCQQSTGPGPTRLHCNNSSLSRRPRPARLSLPPSAAAAAATSNSRRQHHHRDQTCCQQALPTPQGWESSPQPGHQQPDWTAQQQQQQPAHQQPAGPRRLSTPCRRLRRPAAAARQQRQVGPGRPVHPVLCC